MFYSYLCHLAGTNCTDGNSFIVILSPKLVSNPHNQDDDDDDENDDGN